MKILTIVGARPQFIKASALSRAIENEDGITEVLLHTGQHFDANMSAIFFEQMGIPKPDYHLKIDSLSHGAMTGRMLENIEPIIAKEKPDWVIVYGDTDTTLAGALAAKKMHVRLAHVEAGLRSYNMCMPEEINRILTDRISDLLFCPTQKAIENLKKEGFDGFDAVMVLSGDIMLDVANYYAGSAVPPINDVPENFLLATIHRAENTSYEDHLREITGALQAISLKTPVVLPLHPGTRKKLIEYNIKITAPNLIIIEPVGYLEMIWLLQKCQLVITDSGGMQKEAFFFKKPCVTMRDETEWTELADYGYNTVAGRKKNDIISAYETMCHKELLFNINLYGDGHCAEQIVSALKNYSS